MTDLTRDLHKLLKLADAIVSIQTPELESDLGQSILEDCKANLKLVAAHLRVDAGMLRKITEFPELGEL